ncbi:MAG: glycosyl hydrolase [bacterium]
MACTCLCLYASRSQAQRTGERAVSGPIDPHATTETRALFLNLRSLARSHVLLGHQDDLAYGHDWIGESGRSDVKDVAGSYPAVYGWELGGLEHDKTNNIDGVPFADMRRWIVEGYGRGAVITISWHMDNLSSGGNAWDTTSNVRAILPGGLKHRDFVQWLDRFASFANDLRARGPSGTEVLVPVIFRPFHEVSGSWFWWGASHATDDDYRALWRFTVDYLRNEKGVHNLLYSYAPNADGAGHDHYMNAYPGDEYVDVLGYDEYFRPPHAGDADAVVAMSAHLRWLVTTAESKAKIPALTETGYELIPDSTWWTSALLPAIKSDSIGRRIAWVLLWRNANRAKMGRDHFYAPYKGQASAADFARFRRDPLMMFESDLPPLYRLPR